MTDCLRHWNPEGIFPPASRYSHAVLATGATKWLHLAGQLGIDADGRSAEGFHQLARGGRKVEEALDGCVDASDERPRHAFQVL